MYAPRTAPFEVARVEFERHECSRPRPRPMTTARRRPGFKLGPGPRARGLGERPKAGTPANRSLQEMVWRKWTSRATLDDDVAVAAVSQRRVGTRLTVMSSSDQASASPAGAGSGFEPRFASTGGCALPDPPALSLQPIPDDLRQSPMPLAQWPYPAVTILDPTAQRRPARIMRPRRLTRCPYRPTRISGRRPARRRAVRRHATRGAPGRHSRDSDPDDEPSDRVARGGGRVSVSGGRR